jgi:hypothetical protein
MLDSLVNDIVHSDWAAILVVGALLLVATEVGFRIGHRHSPEKRKAHLGQSGTLQGALLGVLGLLLGFTFAMAVGRYDTRRQLALDEANAIGTAWLRAGLLSDGARDTIRPALVDYVEARLQGAPLDPGSVEFKNQAARSENNQAQMWRTTVEEVKSRDLPSTALFTASLNVLIDMDAKRQAATRAHVPGTVWLLLLAVSVTVCATTGYASALSGSGRHALSMIVLPGLLTIVITIIADLDNPQRGLIKVSQQSMIDLQNTLKKYQ